MDNTYVADNIATPCPSCGARCFAVLDLDKNNRCNVCRNLKVADSNSYNVRRGRPSNNTLPPETLEKRTNAAMSAKEARHNFRLALQFFLPQLIADLRAMPPFMRWTILDKLAKYHLPTFTQKGDEDEDGGTGEKKIVLEVHYVDGDADADVNQVRPEIQIVGSNDYGLNDGAAYTFTPHSELPSTDDED